MNISIRYLDPGDQKPPFKMFVRPFDTVALLKYQISEKHSIPIYEQRMFPTIPGQEPPGEERSLESCGFAEGDVIKMYRIPTPFPIYGMDEVFKIGIRPILANVFLLEVRRSDTFRAVKRRIEDEKGYMANTQDFRFGDDEDEKTLDECRVIEPMTLQFHLKRRKRINWDDVGSARGIADVGGGGGVGGGGDGEEAGAGDGEREGGGARAGDGEDDRVAIRGLQSGRGSPSY